MLLLPGRAAMRRASLLSTCAAALAAAAPAAAQEVPTTGDAPAPVSTPTASGKKVFTAADFARFAPRTAFDMLAQVPGFSIRGEDGNSRGLGQATGNVLLNGKRLSGKSTDPVTALAVDPLGQRSADRDRRRRRARRSGPQRAGRQCRLRGEGQAVGAVELSPRISRPLRRSALHPRRRVGQRHGRPGRIYRRPSQRREPERCGRPDHHHARRRHPVRDPRRSLARQFRPAAGERPVQDRRARLLARQPQPAAAPVPLPLRRAQPARPGQWGRSDPPHDDPPEGRELRDRRRL